MKSARLPLWLRVVNHKFVTTCLIWCAVGTSIGLQPIIQAQTQREKIVSSYTDPDSPNLKDETTLKLDLPASAKSLTGEQSYDVGEAFLLKGQAAEAAAYLARAAELLPKDAFAQGNFAIALHQIGRSGMAVPYFRKAAALHPVPVYFSNLAQALWSIGEIEEAILALRTTIRLDETQVASMALLMQLEHYTCEILFDYDAKYGRARRVLAAALDKAEAGNGSLIGVWTPSQVIQLDVSERDMMRLCRLYTSDAARQAAPGPMPPPADPRPRQRLRIGYVSYSFGLGVRNGLMYHVFSAHNRHKVEVFGFAIRPHDSDADEAEKRRVEGNVEHFVDISQVPMDRVAAYINGYGPHVLIDICGLHANGTLIYRIYASVPAPVQVAYMAFAGSTGADYIHYLITDKVTSPPEYRMDYAEGLLYMPHSYHVNSHAIRFPLDPAPAALGPAALAAARRAAGLPAPSGPGAALFCSYNQFFKLDPRVMSAWAAALRRAPAAEMVLVELMFHPHAVPRIRRALAARGVAAAGARVASVGRAATAAHVARSRLMDVHLDSRLQSGHTTTVDALWAGTPVVVWPARSLVSRAAAGIAAAAGLGWAVARGGEDYADLAARLANSRAAMARARRAVARARTVGRGRAGGDEVGGGLFDVVGWVREWEQALGLAWAARAGPGSRAARRVGGTTPVRWNVAVTGNGGGQLPTLK